jgi:hypothetical protein
MRDGATGRQHREYRMDPCALVGDGSRVRELKPPRLLTAGRGHEHRRNSNTVLMQMIPILIFINNRLGLEQQPQGVPATPTGELAFRGTESSRSTGIVEVPFPGW